MELYLREYLAQSNSSADCVDPNYKIKFVDGLTILKKVNLLLVGLASHSYKTAVRSDIPVNNQFIPAEHLQTKEYLEKIKDWTTKQKIEKMILNQNKTKVMIFNFTDKYKFTTKLNLNDENLEVVKQAKLLGVIISDDLK